MYGVSLVTELLPGAPLLRRQGELGGPAAAEASAAGVCLPSHRVGRILFPPSGVSARMWAWETEREKKEEPLVGVRGALSTEWLLRLSPPGEARIEPLRRAPLMDLKT